MRNPLLLGVLGMSLFAACALVPGTGSDTPTPSNAPGATSGPAEEGHDPLGESGSAAGEGSATNETMSSGAPTMMRPLTCEDRHDCETDHTCSAPIVCASGVCSSGLCAAPSPTDGVHNGDETDVDCGGARAPKCENGALCAAHGDCKSDGCGDDGRCAIGRSCTSLHGGRTCGAGEYGQAAASHESCCTSLEVPRSAAAGGAYRLDKYPITAARMRQFVERTGGNIKGYVQRNRPAWFPAAWDPYLPERLGSATDNEEYKTVTYELGPYVHGAWGPGNEGCYVSDKVAGAHTYWFDAPTTAASCSPGESCVQAYSKEVLDEKPLNCATFFMTAAFCAWDGGRLPTLDEMSLAWHGVGTTRSYPWGATPAPAGYNGAYEQDGAWPTYPAGGATNRANYNYNYFWPQLRIRNDYSLYISAPGRFPLGAGPYGHMDMAGNLLAHTLSSQWFPQGSWEGHTIPFALINFPATNKYLATGARCRRG